MSNPLPQQTTLTVISTMDVPSTDPARLGKMDALVTYRADPLHSFTIRIPADGLTPPILDAAIKSDWAARKVYINRQIVV